MPETAIAPPPVFNRLKAVLLHIPFYSIETLARLAVDTELSKASLSRLTRGKSRPSFRTAEAIAWAISKRSGVQIHPCEIFSADGAFPTPSACKLMGCRGCLPPEAWNEQTDRIKPLWRNAKPGEWSRFESDPSSPGNKHLTDIS